MARRAEDTGLLLRSHGLAGTRALVHHEAVLFHPSPCPTSWAQSLAPFAWPRVHGADPRWTRSTQHWTRRRQPPGGTEPARRQLVERDGVGDRRGSQPVACACYIRGSAHSVSVTLEHADAPARHRATQDAVRCLWAPPPPARSSLLVLPPVAAGRSHVPGGRVYLGMAPGPVS